MPSRAQYGNNDTGCYGRLCPRLSGELQDSYCGYKYEIQEIIIQSYATNQQKNAPTKSRVNIRRSWTIYAEKRFSTAFQLITSQMALKYSALRFWYCK